MFRKIRRKIATTIWNLSESLNIPLGKLAPFIFGEMIGCKGCKIKSKKVRK